MKKHPEIYLEYILESIALIEEYTRGIAETDFFQSIRIQDMVIRRLEIIEEAVKRLPTNVKSMSPETPWKKIAGMRDVLIHEYFGVDLKLTWQVVKKELQPLKDTVEKIRNDIVGLQLQF
ncbi:MAG: DUF86 domain-containing protein [Ignavibacteriae bacterium]|nr:DUF86 domain-containing protein [Ignavibacteriota bacterium]